MQGIIEFGTEITTRREEEKRTQYTSNPQVTPVVLKDIELARKGYVRYSNYKLDVDPRRDNDVSPMSSNRCMLRNTA